MVLLFIYSIIVHDKTIIEYIKSNRANIFLFFFRVTFQAEAQRSRYQLRL